MLTNFKILLKHKPIFNNALGLVNNIIPKPILFDVSLRDGLQSLTKEQQNNVTISDKLEIYNDIVNNYNPENIEIGSIVSNKLLPIFNDTLEIIKHVNKYKHNLNTNHYIVIPNSNKLKQVIHFKNNTNFSFISSVSNSFQIKNTHKSIKQNAHDLEYMLHLINTSYLINTKTKLYISCITECPIEGKIDKNKIIQAILFYNNLDIDTICLSDTCGSLTLEEFNYIIEKCIQYNVNIKKLALHLHVNSENENIVEQIIHSALANNIVQFDVSMLKLGGCPMILSPSKMSYNLSYNLFYKCYNNYIINNYITNNFV